MQYTTQVSWERDTDQPFNAKSYDRTHTIAFNGGSTIKASSAPEFLGNASLPNPEELLTAAISSCFMLTFLYWASLKGLTIDHYTAKATGTLAKNTDGKMVMTEVLIEPQVTFNGTQPEPALLEELFEKAHDHCFISNSVKTAVKIAEAHTQLI
jgi:organic hydroperoxide reductase OsmC/OhrA